MFIDVTLRPRDASRGTYDAQLYAEPDRGLLVRLYPRDASRGTYDVQVRATNRIVVSDITPPPVFPTQFSGFRVYRAGGGAIDLCLVAEADAPTGMGGVVKLRKNSTTYVAYLVETSDPNASAVRIQTTGIKSIRLKT